MQSITIDRNKRLKEEPHTGHNRWHPDIAPLIEVEPGEEVVLETRDASDCQIKPGMTVVDLTNLDAKVAHPLTGPVYIKGARPGDLLEIEYLDILPQPCGWTRNRPGAGFLRDLFTEPYLAHWDIQDGWATSPQIPGVRIPNGSFMGTAGIAPSRAQIEAWSRREAALVARGGTHLNGRDAAFGVTLGKMSVARRVEGSLHIDWDQQTRTFGELLGVYVATVFPWR